MPTGSDYSALILPKPSKAPSKPAKLPGMNLRGPLAAQGPTAPVAKAAPKASAPERNIAKLLPTNTPTLPEARKNAELFSKARPVIASNALASPKGLVAASKAATPKGPKSSLLATITDPSKLASAVATDIPKEFKGTGVLEKGIKSGANLLGNVEATGYSHVLPQKVAKILGNGIRNIVEIPAQVLPAAYIGGRALKTAVTPPGDRSKAENDEIGNLATGLVKESAVAHLLKGDVKGAAKLAERNPGFAILEASGLGAAADRAAGAAARAGAFGSDMAERTALADPGATTVSRKPQHLIGNATEPLPPYNKQLSVRLRQARNDASARPGQSLLENMRGKSLSQRMTKHFDAQAGEINAVQRYNRAKVVNDRMSSLRGARVKGTPFHVPIPGHEAVNAFARGLLADPKVINEGTGNPLYRDHLKDLIEFHGKPVEGESGFEKEMREANVAHYQGLQDNVRLQKDPHQAKAAAVQYARDLKKIEPELVDAKVISPQSARVAKLTDPFQFHWRDQSPRVEESPPLNERGQKFVQAERARADADQVRKGSLIELKRAEASGDKGAKADALARHKVNVKAHKSAVANVQKLVSDNPADLHESPFSVAGPLGTRRHVAIEQVEKDLKEKHGVDPNEIGFVSNRPFVNPDSAYYKNGQDPSKAGFWPQKFRTGSAFTKGLYDTSEEAMVRQHATNRGIADQVHASRMQNRTYALTKEHMAKLLEEKAGTLAPEARQATQNVIDELRSPGTYFKGDGENSAWTAAQRAIHEVEYLNPDLRGQLTPGRIASPYAPAEQLDAISKHTIQGVQDRLDPNLFEQDRGADRFPEDESLQHDAGTVGVFHKAVADRISEYDKQMGSTIGKLLRKPANFWRMSNIALSPKHPVGLAQELGIRMGANNMGVLSRIRANKAAQIWERALAEPDFLKQHPEAINQYRYLQAKTKGTVGEQALNLGERITQKQLATTRLGAAQRALSEVTDSKVGAPLKVAKAVFRGYENVTRSILKGQEKLLGHQAELTGVGKHVDSEVKRLTGKSIPLMGDVDKHVQQAILGQITDPDALAATSKRLIDYFGDWSKASPNTKRVLAVAPFWNWYVNSLKFVYNTLPMHHPIKTSLLVTLEDATAAQRRAMGQGHGSVEKLEEEQQGGIPVGRGKIANQQYYTPQGTVTSPLSTFTGLFLPEIQDAYKAATGSGPFGETLKNSKGEEATSATERGRVAALSLLESFFPPSRWANEIKAGKGSKVYDPFKISKERTETGPREVNQPKSGLPGLPTINVPTVSLPTVNLPTIQR